MMLQRGKAEAEKCRFTCKSPVLTGIAMQHREAFEPQLGARASAVALRPAIRPSTVAVRRPLPDK
ncbi:hypothetical protein SAMN05444161_7368 [Rhizobiales bacterium GAS191]|nr:hypothetical protein SAMN05519103_06716 [Rhizobiales bacterium GAS113]SEE83542.1 hypothetical protein SAMN05444161_7368 [Rhizobiales bacterium GAS191]